MFGMYREISKIELKVGLEDFGLRKLTYLLEKGLYLGSITNSEEVFIGSGQRHRLVSMTRC